ncbi:MAG: pseudouridine synthase [Acidobacteriota bacterium]
MLERLQKIIANAGIASRRAAEEMILRGEVIVNGKVVTELGTKADSERDHIKVRGKLINPHGTEKEKRYYLVNKPRGYICTVKDPKNRPLVASLLPPSSRRGLHPIGRLDFNSEGLIILTNDGELTELLTRAGKIEKVYHVKVKGAPTREQINILQRGIKLGDKVTAPAKIKLLEQTRKGGNCWYEVILIQGKNQQIRKMFDAIGHSVTKLHRKRIGHLTDEKLPLGKYRELKLSDVKKFFQTSSTGQTPVKSRKPKPLHRMSSR